MNFQKKKLTGSKLSRLENEIAQGKFSFSKYLDEKGEKRDMYVLPLEKAKQVLLRESKFVRKAVIEYIDYLEPKQAIRGACKVTGKGIKQSNKEH